MDNFGLWLPLEGISINVIFWLVGVLGQGLVKKCCFSFLFWNYSRLLLPQGTWLKVMLLCDAVEKSEDKNQKCSVIYLPSCSMLKSLFVLFALTCQPMTLITFRDFPCSGSLLGSFSATSQKMFYNKSVKSTKKKNLHWGQGGEWWCLRELGQTAAEAHGKVEGSDCLGSDVCERATKGVRCGSLDLGKTEVAGVRGEKGRKRKKEVAWGSCWSSSIWAIGWNLCVSFYFHLECQSAGYRLRSLKTYAKCLKRSSIR